LVVIIVRHDLAVVRLLGTAAWVIGDPREPYTQFLLSSVLPV
jgi:ABC-type phosphonate transport system ATPase subunit